MDIIKENDYVLINKKSFRVLEINIGEFVVEDESGNISIFSSGYMELDRDKMIEIRENTLKNLI
jgi:signal peptidase I